MSWIPCVLLGSAYVLSGGSVLRAALGRHLLGSRSHYVLAAGLVIRRRDVKHHLTTEKEQTPIVNTTKITRFGLWNVRSRYRITKRELFVRQLQQYQIECKIMAGKTRCFCLVTKVCLRVTVKYDDGYWKWIRLWSGGNSLMMVAVTHLQMVTIQQEVLIAHCIFV
jgi:hypothetical protein